MISILHLFLPGVEPLHGLYGHAFALLVEATLKVTLFLSIAAALALALRRASAASRHLVWTLALCATLALPVLSLALPVCNVPILSSFPSPPTGTRVIIIGNSAAGPTNPQIVAASNAWQSAVPAWILFLWVVGSMLLVARMAVGEVRVRKVADRSRRFQTISASSILENASRRLQVYRSVELRTSTETAIPFTRGIFHAAIILPQASREWPQRHLEFVVVHELAHVRRNDYLTQVLAQVTCALFWFHPFVWIAAAQTRKERECACDDVVLSVGHRAADYAEFLLALGRCLQKLNPMWSTTVAIAQPSHLEVRMKALLDSKLNHRLLPASRVLFAAVIAFALLVPAAVIHGSAKKDTGSISGTLHDPSGAVIPGASAILINSMTGAKIASGTGDDGTFIFPSMPAGRYRLEFAKAGFARAQTGEFWLGRSRDLHQDYTLDLGWVSEEVIVRGHRPAQAAAAPSREPHRIRVGGLVQAAKLIKMAKPVYPPSLERKGIEGTVILRAVIGTSGKILSLEPSNGPDPLFLKSAMDAVNQWQYQPTLLNGVPVEVATTITMVFRLDQ